MKHLILILSIALMGTFANANGDMNAQTNCPHSQASRFADTKDDKKNVKVDTKEKPKAGTATNGV